MIYCNGMNVALMTPWFIKKFDLNPASISTAVYQTCITMTNVCFKGWFETIFMLIMYTLRILFNSCCPSLMDFRILLYFPELKWQDHVQFYYNTKGRMSLSWPVLGRETLFNYHWNIATWPGCTWHHKSPELAQRPISWRYWIPTPDC